MDLNRATLIGNITRDPEVRSTPTGKSVATVGIATNRMWTDAAGQKQKQAEFHNVVFWGKLAEIAGQYLKKGKKIYVEGRLQTRDWTGQDGVKKYRTEIVADNMIMLDHAGGAVGSPATSHSSAPSYQPDEASSAPMKEVVEEEIKVEDIPF
ncbi:MAG: single-stranded DNA-binding protein [bacterium]|nr:single-stranded DNA-binding protein [bacterium]